jgi:hypothetical protein
MCEPVFAFAARAIASWSSEMSPDSTSGSANAALCTEGTPTCAMAPGCARWTERSSPYAGGAENVVGDTGIEPVTSSVSGKRATAAPIARPGLATGPSSALVLRRGDEVETGFEPV